MEENFHGVFSQGIDVMLMVVRLDIRTERGFEVQEYRRLVDIASWVLHNGDRANFTNDKEKV